MLRVSSFSMKWDVFIGKLVDESLLLFIENKRKSKEKQSNLFGEPTFVFGLELLTIDLCSVYWENDAARLRYDEFYRLADPHSMNLLRDDYV